LVFLENLISGILALQELIINIPVEQLGCTIEFENVQRRFQNIF
jgi:hypothetical protein